MTLFEKGTRAGKYQIVGIIGSGGMGVVYEALHLELKKRVALKTLHPEYAQQPVAQARFVREGEAASRIRHPHVVDVTDLGSHEGVPYLVMEFLEGMDLAAYLIQKERLSVEETLELMLPVVAAVAAGHDEGVVHRDLKPHNIFLSRGRHADSVHPKVLDFGVSKVADPLTGESNLTATSAMMGTVAYMSPEQAMGAKLVDGRSDQYALALIIYESVTGHRAHEGDNTLAVLRQIGDGAIEPPSTFATEVPPAFEQVLMKALSLDPRERYQSMYGFGRALLPFAPARSSAQWQGAFQREPLPSGLSSVSVAIDKQPSSTRVRTLRQGSVPRQPAPAAPEPQPAPAPEPAAARGAAPTMPVPQFPKTVPLPQAAALLPVKTTLGQSASELLPAAAPRKKPPVALIAGGLLAVAGIAIAAVALRPSSPPVRPPDNPAQPAPPTPPPPPVRQTFRVVVAVTPAEAQLELDGLPAGQGAVDRTLTADGREHVLRATAPGFEPRTLTFVDAPPPPTLELARTAPAAPEPRRKSSTARPRTEKPHPPAKPSVGANQAPILKE
jgi:serine/threonine-protein kinase